MSTSHVSYSHYSKIDADNCVLRKRHRESWEVAKRVCQHVHGRTGAYGMYNEMNGHVAWFLPRRDRDDEGVWSEPTRNPDNTMRDLRAYVDRIIKGIRDVSRGAARPPEPILLGVPNGKQQEPVVSGRAESSGGVSEQGRGQRASDVRQPATPDGADSGVNADAPCGGEAVHRDGKHGDRKPRGGGGRHSGGKGGRAKGRDGGKHGGD